MFNFQTSLSTYHFEKIYYQSKTQNALNGFFKILSQNLEVKNQKQNYMQLWVISEIKHASTYLKIHINYAKK